MTTNPSLDAHPVVLAVESTVVESDTAMAPPATSPDRQRRKRVPPSRLEDTMDTQETTPEQASHSPSPDGSPSSPGSSSDSAASADLNVRPNLSYARLAAMAIDGSPEKRCTVGDIYSWIEERYPYYKNGSPWWKVRCLH